MPTTVKDLPFRLNALPTIDGSPPNRCIQTP